MKNSIILNKAIYQINIFLYFKLGLVTFFSLIVSRNNHPFANWIFSEFFLIFQLMTIYSYIKLFKLIRSQKYLKENNTINFFGIINPIIINLSIIIFIITINLIFNKLNFLVPFLILIYIIISLIILKSAFKKIGVFDKKLNLTEQKAVEKIATVFINNEELEKKYLDKKIKYYKDFVLLQSIYQVLFIESLSQLSSILYYDFNNEAKISLIVSSIIVFLVAIGLLIWSFISLKKKGVINKAYYFYEIAIILITFIFIGFNIFIEQLYPLENPIRNLMPIILGAIPLIFTIFNDIDYSYEFYFLKIIDKINKQKNDLESTK